MSHSRGRGRGGEERVGAAKSLNLIGGGEQVINCSGDGVDDGDE